MFKSIKPIFGRVPAKDVLRAQLLEAERLHAEHAAAAEHHAALAEMYKKRIKRILALAAPAVHIDPTLEQQVTKAMERAGVLPTPTLRHVR